MNAQGIIGAGLGILALKVTGDIITEGMKTNHKKGFMKMKKVKLKNYTTKF